MTTYKLSLSVNGRSHVFGICNIAVVLRLLTKAAQQGENISNVTIFKYQ